MYVHRDPQKTLLEWKSSASCGLSVGAGSPLAPAHVQGTSTLIVRMLVWLLVVVVWRDERVIMEQWAN